MGLFDVYIERNLEKSKIEVVNYLKNELTPLSKNTTTSENSLIFENFKPKYSLLNYNLEIVANESKKNISLNIFGELQNLWVLVILIIIGILLTYGIGVILLYFIHITKR